VLQCGDQYCKDKGYFDALFHQLGRRSCGNHFYTHLYHRNVSGFDIAELPATKLKKAIVRESGEP
jgi:hypothetical protein